MTTQIALVLVLTFVINLITKLSYSVRIVGIRTGRIAISFALFNMLVLGAEATFRRYIVYMTIARLLGILLAQVLLLPGAWVLAKVAEWL